MRVRTDGKFFVVGGSRFHFRGVAYSPSAGGSTTGAGIERDLITIEAAGFTVVSTPDLPGAATERSAATGLRFLLRPDLRLWTEIVGASARQRHRLVRAASADLRRMIRARGATDALLGVALSAGPGAAAQPGVDGPIVAGVLRTLTHDLHDSDADLLVGAACRWPITVDCSNGMDFLTVDFPASSAGELRRALYASHREVGDLPLVLGQAEVSATVVGGGVDHLLHAALEAGCGGTLSESWDEPAAWPRARVVKQAELNRRTVRDLDMPWPEISVVICAYNAEATLEECLSACDRLDYPRLEVLVVDDGSTDRTRAIAEAHPRVRLVPVPHGGLSAARNAGYRAALGELVAYLDSDAYPPPEWIWYLALASFGDDVAACGGPNVPPTNDPVGAHVVARSPGGPIPQVVSEDRARHVPGCNMAFTRQILEKLGGFDEALWTASDDLEFDWRLLEAGQQIGYHPAALVWHHRRPGLRPYLRQQRGYGRSQAIVEARYPERFPSGQRLRNLRTTLFGGTDDTQAQLAVAYRSLCWRERPLIGVAHQWGMPAAVLLACTSPLGLVKPAAATPAVAAVSFIGALFVGDAVLAGRDNPLPEQTLRCRGQIATHRLLRPLAFRWGHFTERRARRSRSPDRIDRLS
jgi:GT2 family glycosyltransferase